MAKITGAWKKVDLQVGFLFNIIFKLLPFPLIIGFKTGNLHRFLGHFNFYHIILS